MALPSHRRRHPMGRIARWTLGLIAAAGLAAGAEAAAISWDGLHDRLGKADVGVVLGNRVAHGRPSAWLAGRLGRTLDLYREGYFPLIIVSGGTGPGGYDEPEVMRDYLVRRGVPPDAVLMDKGGINTWATARDTAAIMRARGLKSVMAVSQFYHMPRTRLALHRWGVEEVYTAHSHYHDHRDVWSTVREMAGYPAYLFRRRDGA